MTVSIWQEAQDQPLGDFDDVVIGAGLVGAWAATALAARGRAVALVDARHPAAGASGRNGGFVLTAQREHYPDLIAQVGRERARELFGLVAQNVRLMRHLANAHRVPIQEGAARVAEHPAYADELERWAHALDEDGFSVRFAREDPYDAGFLAYMQVLDDFTFNPATLAARLADASGAHLIESNEVFHIDHAGRGVTVRGRRGILRAERAWITTNGYAGDLHPALAAVVRPGRGQIIVTPPAPSGLIPLGGISGTGYFRQLEDGRVMIGGGRLQFEAQEYTAEDRVTPNLQAFLLDLLGQRFPAAPQRVERAWAGIQGFTPDRRAVVGLLPGLDRVAFAVGFSGYGNSIGLVAAERMIALALDGEPPGPLDARRFEALR